MAFKPLRPTHKIKIRPRHGGFTTIAGRAWFNPEKKSMSIQLNTGIVLDWHDDIFIIAVPLDEDENCKDNLVG